MLILYNLLHLLILLPLLPLVCIYLALQPKYRKHIPRRLGINLKKSLNSLVRKDKTVWIHALSVGEIASAIPLIEKIRQDLHDSTIIISVSTKTGYDLAKKHLSGRCDVIIASPVDVLFVVDYFIGTLQPDLFILVETDFWPNIVQRLHTKKVPLLLINGRISKSSFQNYKRFSFFLQPLFRAFSHICVQTDADRKKFAALGVSSTKISKLSNLKYASANVTGNTVAHQLLNAIHDPIFIAGSTHQGEESIVMDAFIELQKELAIKLIIAPRDITRTSEILTLAKSRNLETQLRSSGKPFIKDLFILDTIGELPAFYSQATLCFVGGSLVDHGGHNPLEPASHGKVVLFGPYMSDFEEISDELITSSAGFCITNQAELVEVLKKLAQDEHFRNFCGEAAKSCVARHEGLLHNYIQMIRQYL